MWPARAWLFPPPFSSASHNFTCAIRSAAHTVCLVDFYSGVGGNHREKGNFTECLSSQRGNGYVYEGLFLAAPPVLRLIRTTHRPNKKTVSSFSSPPPPPLFLCVCGETKSQRKRPKFKWLDLSSEKQTLETTCERRQFCPSTQPANNECKILKHIYRGKEQKETLHTLSKIFDQTRLMRHSLRKRRKLWFYTGFWNSTISTNMILDLYAVHFHLLVATQTREKEGAIAAIQRFEWALFIIASEKEIRVSIRWMCGNKKRGKEWNILCIQLEVLFLAMVHSSELKKKRALLVNSLGDSWSELQSQVHLRCWSTRVSFLPLEGWSGRCVWATFSFNKISDYLGRRKKKDSRRCTNGFPFWQLL